MFVKLSRAGKPGKKPGQEPRIACEREFTITNRNLGGKNWQNGQPTGTMTQRLFSDVEDIIYDGQAVVWNSAWNIVPGFLNIQKSSNFGVYKNHTRNLFKMQIPCPEFLIPYIKGRNQEYVFLTRTFM